MQKGAALFRGLRDVWLDRPCSGNQGGHASASCALGGMLWEWSWRGKRGSFLSMSEHPPPALLADALRLPAQDRLALAAELIDSVEGTDDPEWDQAWLAELDRRAQEVAKDPSKLEHWAVVCARILSELQSE